MIRQVLHRKILAGFAVALVETSIITFVVHRSAKLDRGYQENKNVALGELRSALSVPMLLSTQ
jgi:hypothetical protein